MHRLDLTLEACIHDNPPFHQLFNPETLAACDERLASVELHLKRTRESTKVRGSRWQRQSGAEFHRLALLASATVYLWHRRRLYSSRAPAPHLHEHSPSQTLQSLSQRGALWDHLFPFSRQSLGGWKEGAAKTATPLLNCPLADATFPLADTFGIGPSLDSTPIGFTTHSLTVFFIWCENCQ